MRIWWRRRSRSGDDARRRQVTAQAKSVLVRLRMEGQPASYIRSLEQFVDTAPELLALGPVPASLAMRVLNGLGLFDSETHTRFLETLTAEFASPSPTLRAILRSGLVALDQNGCPELTAKGTEFVNRLRHLGAFDVAPWPPDEAQPLT